MAIAIGILALGAALGSGCAPRAEPQPDTSETDSTATTEAIAPASGAGGLPDYAYRSAMALRGYQIAVTEGALLAALPCYCGCGQEPLYRNLQDCFIDPDGGFRSHGANCLVCLEEAEDAARWRADGLSVKQVRDRIDAEYEGRGPPTDTPPVEE